MKYNEKDLQNKFSQSNSKGISENKSLASLSNEGNNLVSQIKRLQKELQAIYASNSEPSQINSLRSELDLKNQEFINLKSKYAEAENQLLNNINTIKNTAHIAIEGGKVDKSTASKLSKASNGRHASIGKESASYGSKKANEILQSGKKMDLAGESLKKYPHFPQYPKMTMYSTNRGSIFNTIGGFVKGAFKVVGFAANVALSIASTAINIVSAVTVGAIKGISSLGSAIGGTLIKFGKKAQWSPPLLGKLRAINFKNENWQPPSIKHNDKEFKGFTFFKRPEGRPNERIEINSKGVLLKKYNASGFGKPAFLQRFMKNSESKGTLWPNVSKIQTPGMPHKAQQIEYKNEMKNISAGMKNLFGDNNFGSSKLYKTSFSKNKSSIGLNSAESEIRNAIKNVTKDITENPIKTTDFNELKPTKINNIKVYDENNKWLKSWRDYADKLNERKKLEDKIKINYEKIKENELRMASYRENEYYRELNQKTQERLNRLLHGGLYSSPENHSITAEYNNISKGYSPEPGLERERDYYLNLNAKNKEKLKNNYGYYLN